MIKAESLGLTSVTEKTFKEGTIFIGASGAHWIIDQIEIGSGLRMVHGTVLKSGESWVKGSTSSFLKGTVIGRPLIYCPADPNIRSENPLFVVLSKDLQEVIGTAKDKRQLMTVLKNTDEAYRIFRVEELKTKVKIEEV